MPKVLELIVGETSVSDENNVHTITSAKNTPVQCKLDADGNYAYNFPTYIDTDQYGFLDMNEFHDTNTPFTLEFTITDANSTQIDSKPYNYVTIGRKTYSKNSDAITIGVADGFIAMGTVTQSEIKKKVTTIAPSTERSSFTFTFDPNKFNKKAALFKNGVLLDHLDTVEYIYDCVLFFGTSGTNNETGWNNKMDLSKDIMFKEKIKFYSGLTMDVVDFTHKSFSNAINPIPNICNNSENEIVFSTFTASGDLTDINDIYVTLKNPHSDGFINYGEFDSKSNGDFTYKFSNLDKIITTNTFIDYDIDYLSKSFSISPTVSRLYIDSVAPTMQFSLNDIRSDSMDFKVTSISDGTYSSDVSSAFTGYSITVNATDREDEIVSIIISDPTLDTVYTLLNLTDGRYYDITATITDAARNTSGSILPSTVNSLLPRQYYAPNTVRTIDTSVPGVFSMIRTQFPDNNSVSFDLSHISDNAVVNDSNPLQLFQLITSNLIAGESEIKSALLDKGTVNTFTSETSTFYEAPSSVLTNGEEIGSTFSYYYSMIKDADSNSTLGVDDLNDSKHYLRFFNENSLVSHSTTSDNESATNIASDTDKITINLQSLFSTSVNNIDVVINSQQVNYSDITETDSKNFVIEYDLATDASNSDYDDYINITVHFNNNENLSSETLDSFVLLRGSNIVNAVGPFTNVFETIGLNEITSTTYRTFIDIKSYDKIIKLTNNVEMDLQVFDDSNNIIDSQTKSFSGYVNLPFTVIFTGLQEGFTYNLKAKITNDLSQTYTIDIQDNVTTENALPINTSFNTSDSIFNNIPSIELTGCVVTDANSSYDIYLAALQSSVFPTSESNIKNFFENTPLTKRLQNIAKGTITDIEENIGFMNNTDSMFSNLTTIKAYDGSNYNVSDIAMNTTSLTFIGMIVDHSFDSNVVTFDSTHDFIYDFNNINIINNKNASSSFVTSNDTISVSWDTNYQTAVDAYSFKFFNVDQVVETTNYINWTSTITVPAATNDLTFIDSNIDLQFNAEGSERAPMTSSLQMDSKAPDWNFVTVVAQENNANANAIDVNILMNADEISKSEPLLFRLEASNDGSNATDDDAGKTFLSRDYVLDFSTVLTQSVTIDGLSPGLDYFISGELFDGNSNSSKLDFTSGVNNGLIFTEDSDIPQILTAPTLNSTTSNITLSGLQVGDSNSVYSYYIGVSKIQSREDVVGSLISMSDEYKIFINTLGDINGLYSSVDVPRGELSTMPSVTLDTDIDKSPITSGTQYYATMFITDVRGNFNTGSWPIISEYPTSEIQDDSGVTGGLTHLFDYNLSSLTNAISLPHGLIVGKNSPSYTKGFIGDKAVFLNETSTTDFHSIQVSTVSMKDHVAFTFATWLQCHDTSTELKELFHYDDDHYLLISDGTIKTKWGADTAHSETVIMEYSSNDWNHIAMTVDTASATKSINVYFNTVNVFTNESVNLSHVPSDVDYFHIGGPNDCFVGILDDTRIYNSILTAADVGLLYSIGGNVLNVQFDANTSGTDGYSFTTSDGVELTTTELANIIDVDDTATGESSIVFDGDTTIELSGDSLENMEAIDGELTESTISLWIKPSTETFRDNTVLVEYFADIGYSITVTSEGLIQFNIVETPPPEPLESQKRLVLTGGGWETSYDYYYFETTSIGQYVYGLVGKNDTNRNDGMDVWDLKYDPTNKKWYDVGSDTPAKWGIDGIGTNLKAFPTDPNMPIHYWYTEIGNFKIQFNNPYYVAPSYRYLAFYGETGSGSNGRPTFQEIELTLGTPLNDFSEIKYGVNDTGITFHESKAWTYNSGRNGYSTIMNGDKSFGSPRIMYSGVNNTDAIFWYMDLGTGVAADVNGGTFWTYNTTSVDFTIGKLYGTNTDPALFADGSLIENYEHVCDLTKQTST